ncbi:EF-hand domain [Macleaya cordata]|uniref:EF-hand domain n=1 Tax=Macleaya cordata TaxID=56857 RepID=A0A200QP35_MACCD|nr:EF-hand domain [Macleaya cordata]
MVEDVDSDRDGFTDLNESIDLNTIDPEKHLEHVKSTFSILDAIGDEPISPQELQKVFRALGDNASIEDCKRMISDFDFNGDGLVSFEAFKLMMIRISQRNLES